MASIVLATEFEMCVSMADFVSWTAEDEAVANSDLRAIFDALGINIDIPRVHCEYFDDPCRSGRGDVHVYVPKDRPDAGVALDLYSDPLDQLDLVNLYLRCEPSSVVEIARLVSVFFNGASVQVHLSQQSVSLPLRRSIDKAQYPRLIPGSGFVQRQIHHSDSDT